MSEKDKQQNILQQIFIPVLVIIAIGLAFFSGTLWQKVKNLEKGGTTTAQQGTKVTGIGNDKNQSGKLADFLKSAIDPKFLKSCLDSGKYDSRLSADQSVAAGIGIQGTPGFFVNSARYAGAYSWDQSMSDPQTKKEIQNSSMQKVVESALQSSPGAKFPAALSINIDQIKALWGKDIIKFGDVNSKILFVDVSDPSCPYCHIAGGLNPELNKKSGFVLVADGGSYIAPVIEMKKLVDGGQASLAYIYSPGHGNGEMGMKALYCANEQGKFWQVYGLLMTNAGYTLMNGN